MKVLLMCVLLLYYIEPTKSRILILQVIKGLSIVTRYSDVGFFTLYFFGFSNGSAS